MVVYTLEQRFARWACDRLTEDADFGTKKIICSDEAHFCLGMYANKQNCYIGGTENPQSIFCALFLKIALSAAELMPFSHLGAAI